MKRKVRVFIAIAAPLAAVLIAAGCGNSASGSAYSTGPYGSAVVASARSTTGGTTVGVASSRLGRIVVDSKGRTLYRSPRTRTAAARARGPAPRTGRHS